MTAGTAAGTGAATARASRGTVLVAVGGNALVLEDEPGSVDRQQERARELAVQVADLVAEGWQVLVTHGNGPQVGYIVRRGELVADLRAAEGLPDLPLWLAVADSQGGLGHLLVLALDAELGRRDLGARAVGVLTHAVVDRQDPAFSNPTKPIGGTLDAGTARTRQEQDGWQVAEVGPGRFRRVVASPVPLEVPEAEQVRSLLTGGSVVVAGGGGGIPIVRDGHDLHPVDAVVDKDRASAVLAAAAGVDTLVLVTGVDQVAVDFGIPQARPLGEVDEAELRRHLADGQFPAGSMGPKVESALQFLTDGGHRAVITSLPRLRDALAGTAGTHVRRRAAGATTSGGATPHAPQPPAPPAPSAPPVRPVAPSPVQGEIP